MSVGMGVAETVHQRVDSWGKMKVVSMVVELVVATL
jgi:hypothetical protein